MADVLVKRLKPNQGFAFVQPDGRSKDLSVHMSAMERATIDQLPDGQAVLSELERDRSDRVSAARTVLA